jgi:cytochrome c oxidase subunit 4
MTTSEKHITSYEVYGKVLIGLLLLTMVTIIAPTIHLAALTVLIALLLASVKVVIVLLYFMHLKMESKFLRTLVFTILGIYASVILLTFSDYIFR